MAKGYSQETKLVQTGNRRDETTGAVNAPIYMSTAYRHSGVGESTGYDYARTKNPTRDVLEEAIADLEMGSRGFACSSGMAAIQTVLSLFEQGDEIIASLDLYGGTLSFVPTVLAKWGVNIQYVDPRNLELLEEAITDNTRALFIETPTNPQMQEADIQQIQAIAKRNNVLLIVDNTFYTPLLQKPLEEGADIVIHSATKYLGGHNDLVAGLIAVKDPAIGEKLFDIQNGIGMTLGAFDCWLLVRGMKTLSLRMKKHEENAKEVAVYLDEHPLVKEVLYPGKGGMLSFRVTNPELVDPLLRNLSLITFAESLGGVESLMTYPSSQTHADVPEHVRLEIGIDETLMRMSCGIESANDLTNDLRYAFEEAAKLVNV